MKRATAIVLSLMFVWLQALSSAQMSLRPAPDCSCCACKMTDCCVSATTPAAQPLAAVPTNASHQNDFSLFAPTWAAWTLPVVTPPQISSAAAPLPVLAVPLFTRHCALLI